MSTLVRETIYDLADARAILSAWLDETEGEETPELAALWTEWQAKFADKVENTALVIVELLSHAKALKAEEERISQRRKAREAKAEGLKALLQFKLQEVGKTKVDGVLCSVAIQNNPPSVQCLTAMDEAELRNIATFAPQYVTHRETWSLKDRKSVV